MPSTPLKNLFNIAKKIAQHQGKKLVKTVRKKGPSFAKKTSKKTLKVTKKAVKYAKKEGPPLVKRAGRGALRLTGKAFGLAGRKVVKPAAKYAGKQTVRSSKFGAKAIGGPFIGNIIGNEVGYYGSKAYISADQKRKKASFKKFLKKRRRRKR